MRKLTEALDDSQEPRKMTDSGQPRIFYEVHTNGLEMRVSVDPPRLTDEQFDRLFALIEQIRSEREDQ